MGEWEGMALRVEGPKSSLWNGRRNELRGETLRREGV